MRCRLIGMNWSLRISLCLASCCLLLLIDGSDGSSEFKRKYCHEWHLFESYDDDYFVQMLDNLLQASRRGYAGAIVMARDSTGSRFEGKVGCLWHNCQIYDSECYECHSTRDAQVCIESLITELKQGLQQSAWSNGYIDNQCHRTRVFASGERAVPVDFASTTFQVCGLQYIYLGEEPLADSV